jgi:hypothetical protein
MYYDDRYCTVLYIDGSILCDKALFFKFGTLKLCVIEHKNCYLIQYFLARIKSTWIRCIHNTRINCNLGLYSPRVNKIRAKE